MDHTHHITYERKYCERLTDLEARCVGCHEFTHAKRHRDPILDAPICIGRMTIRDVYIAGRMSKQNDWRKTIVSGWDMGRICPPYHAKLPDGRTLFYRGPHWVDMGEETGGHASFCVGPHMAADSWDDGSGGHGGNERSSRLRDPDIKWTVSSPETVVSDRLEELEASDLMFAWLESRECFGTLSEIGFYYACQFKSPKQLVVAMPEWDRELWFSCAMADCVVFAESPLKAWEKLWSGKRDGFVVGDEPDRSELDEAYEEYMKEERIWTDA